MPVEDGYSLIEQLRATRDRPDVANIPAVALTAYARSEDRKQALDSGYDVHVAKPIEPGRLVSAVMRLTRRET
jgi:CheY-like chemotaxis protein